MLVLILGSAGLTTHYDSSPNIPGHPLILHWDLVNMIQNLKRVANLAFMLESFKEEASIKANLCFIYEVPTAFCGGQYPTSRIYIL